VFVRISPGKAVPEMTYILCRVGR